MKNIQQDNSELDEQTKTFLSIIDNLSGKNEIDIEVSGNFDKLLSYNLQHYFILLNLRSDI